MELKMSEFGPRARAVANAWLESNFLPKELEDLTTTTDSKIESLAGLLVQFYEAGSESK